MADSLPAAAQNKADKRAKMAQKLLGALGLARRAGQLAVGFDAACDAAQAGAALVLVCSDTSAGTARRLRTACEGKNGPVETIPLTQGDIATITGKPAGVLAITNKDFKALCLAALAAGRAGDEEDAD